jgi:hypothetical protein
MAAQIGEINQADRQNAIFLNPLEYRPEVRASTALWLQVNRLGRLEFLARLHRSVTIDDMNCFRLRFISDRGDLAGKLLELICADGTGCVYANDNGSEAGLPD